MMMMMLLLLLLVLSLFIFCFVLDFDVYVLGFAFLAASYFVVSCFFFFNVANINLGT